MMIAIDLSKQQALNTDPKTLQQINFTGNLENIAAIFFSTQEANETVLDFFTRNCKSILILFLL